jgi:hypothetical protein
MDRYHVVAGGYLRWLVCDRENDDEVVAVERSFELAQGAADDLNREFEDRRRRHDQAGPESGMRTGG